MLELHLDPVGGIAGDMFVAALLDLRPDLATGLRQALATVPSLEGIEMDLARHNDGVLTGHRFIVRAAPSQRRHRDGTHTHWKSIRHELEHCQLDREAVTHALGIFSCLAEAEAKVHDVPVDEVSFHEVGAWDSIADIVAAGWLVARLAVGKWTVSALPLGAGRVNSDHGLLPVPAPATALLLEGYSTLADGIEGERVTPTGAAIVRYLCKPERKLWSPLVLRATAHGFGTKELRGISNCLRILAFEAEEAPVFIRDHVAVLECEIDDQSAEDLAHAVDHLRRHAGVLDVIQAAVFGKKNRMATHLRVLAEIAMADRIVEAIFEETTTIGVRRTTAERSVLPREQSTLDADGHVLNLKSVRRPSGSTAKVEADDLAGISGHRRRHGLRQAAEIIRAKQESADD